MIAVAFLVTYAAAATALVPALEPALRGYGSFLGALTQRNATFLLEYAHSLSFRPYFALLFVWLAIFAPGGRAARMRTAAETLATYCVVVVAADISLVHLEFIGAPSPFSAIGGIVSGLLGIVVLALAIFRRYELPKREDVFEICRRPSRFANRAIMAAAASAAIVTFLYVFVHPERRLHVPLLGGLGAGGVIFLLAATTILYATTRVRDRAPCRPAGAWPSVAFLVPAHNESKKIEDCVRALKAAAALYPGRCRAVIVDNNSDDETGAIARAALGSGSLLEGVVLDCLERGKGHALNRGLDVIDEDIVVRIDADTTVEPFVLQKAVAYFADPQVGAVSGLPLPSPSRTVLGRIRLMEVFYSVAFMRLAQQAVDGIMVIPGIFACYRRTLLEHLDGFAAGFNGEDADITVRIGRLGYRVIADTEICAYTEVPDTVAHLNEQRQRWARGLFHMAARNLSAVWMMQGTRGAWFLPWSVLNGARRSVMLPLLLGTLLVKVIEPEAFELREISIVAGTFLGLQLAVIVILLAANLRFSTIPFVPLYLPFRVFRSFAALEALLSIPHKEPARVHVRASAGARGMPVAGE